MVKITTTAFIFHKGKVLLVFHKKMNQWMHVGGHVEDNEFFDDALVREIKEEVNLDVTVLNPINTPMVVLPSKLKQLKNPFFVHGTVKEGRKDIAIDYLCKAKEPINVVLQSEELSDFKWVRREELDDLDTFPALKELIVKAFEEFIRINQSH